MLRTACLPALLVAACNGLAPIDAPDLDRLDPVARARVDLGRALFFDPALSGAGDVSCASCHDPARFGTDGLPTSVGTGGATVSRNAPSVFNAALRAVQFWDGRADSLEAQALEPLYAPDEMGQTPDGLRAVLARDYAPALAAAFPDDPTPTDDKVASALADYQRTLPSPSRYDRFLQGDRGAFTDDERRGLRLFRNNCAFCHDGEGVGGNLFERLGDDQPWPASRSGDVGREAITGDARDRLVFAVPSLRNVTQTGPWFHDGHVETLDEAVRLMGWHQLGVRFPDRDVADLVAFLGTLEAETIPAWAWPPGDGPAADR